MKTPTRVALLPLIGRYSSAAFWHIPTASAESASKTSAVTDGYSSSWNAGVAAGGGPDGGVTTVGGLGSRSPTLTPMPPPRDTRVNEPISCTTSSSRSSKSFADRSVTGLPSLFRTTTSTRTAVVTAEKSPRSCDWLDAADRGRALWAWGSAAAAATASATATADRLDITAPA